jgi:hypothetical protein
MNRHNWKAIVTFVSLLIVAPCIQEVKAITGSGTAGYIAKWNTTSDLNNSVIYQYGSGYVGVGTGAATLSDGLTVNGSIVAWGSSSATEIGKFFLHGGGHYLGIRSWTSASGKLPIKLQQEDSSGAVDRLYIDPSGNVGIGTSSPTNMLTVNGLVECLGASNESAKMFMHAGGHYFSIRSYTSNGGKLPISLQQQDSGGLVDRLYINTSGYVGIGTTSPSKPLTVCGNILIKNLAGTADVVELGSGLDYAEGFEVTGNDKPAPGSVLVIDAANPGQLATSSTAYDSRVAGIVAGAKNLGSGVRLGVGQFDCDVAMAGRVYCNVDATDSTVQPGDLLTTSSTPGFAMKASDRARTPGAVLGKAMQGLEKGQKGQILVLVTLQ